MSAPRQQDTPLKPKAVQRGSEPLFLDRDVYRRRRLIDAAKWLPFAGLVLFIGPALMLGTPTPEVEGGRTASRLVYFFFVWLCLIATCAVISRGLVEGTDTSDASAARDASGREER